jgi:hypothetical protein
MQPEFHRQGREAREGQGRFSHQEAKKGAKKDAVFLCFLRLFVAIQFSSRPWRSLR